MPNPTHRIGIERVPASGMGNIVMVCSQGTKELHRKEAAWGQKESQLSFDSNSSSGIAHLPFSSNSHSVKFCAIFSSSEHRATQGMLVQRVHKFGTRCDTESSEFDTEI